MIHYSLQHLLSSPNLPLKLLTVPKYHKLILLLEEEAKSDTVLDQRMFSALLGICFYHGEAHIVFAKNLVLKFNLNGNQIYEIEKVTAIGIRKGDENAKFT